MRRTAMTPGAVPPTAPVQTGAGKQCESRRALIRRGESGFAPGGTLSWGSFAADGPASACGADEEEASRAYDGGNGGSEGEVRGGYRNDADGGEGGHAASNLTGATSMYGEGAATGEPWQRL